MEKKADMTAHDDTLADLRKLDAVVHALGIEDSFEEPAEAVAKLQAEIIRLQNHTLKLAAMLKREGYSDEQVRAGTPYIETMGG